MNIVTIVISSLLPAAIDILRSTVSKMLFGTRALTVDDEIRLMEAETAKIKALAELDAVSGQISRWVADFRASFRYIAAAAWIIISTIIIFSPQVPTEVTKIVLDLLQAVIFFIFGHRTWLYIKDSWKQ